LSEKVVWLLAFVGLYWVFCLYWGMTSARMAGDAKSFFLADRNLPAWVFVLAATGASFSGWLFFVQSDLVFSGGLPAATAALSAITIPLAGVLFLKRQWMLTKRYGYVTPVEMLGEYYGSETIRLLAIVIALVFAVPFIGMQLSAAGMLAAYLSDGYIDRISAMWITTAVVFAYVCFGGLRAAAYVGALQALLLAAGIIGLGSLVYWQIGGFGAFINALARMSEAGVAAPGAGGSGPLSFFEVPGVIQFTSGLGVEAPAGGLWTGVMILSYALALMGLQLAPGFSMLAFATRSPKGFRAQQTWAAAGAMGGLLLLFSIAQGLGVHFLGGSPGAEAGLTVAPLIGGRPEAGVVAALIGSISNSAPWFAALFAVCGLAAVQGITALYLSATSSMLVRDVYRRYLEPDLDVVTQRLYARIVMALLIVIALLIASFAPSAQANLGSLALGFGLQLLPVFAGLCWLAWITPPAALVGLATGLVVVTFTENFGIALAAFFGLDLPWGRWPWTIHSAGWGIVANVTVCFIISLISQRGDERSRRQPYHDFLRSHAGVVVSRHGIRAVAWAATLAWMFFAIGPGVLFGNFAFSGSEEGGSVWLLGVPSLWAWQFVWWALGVLLIWFLGNRMGMSTVPVRMIELLPRSQRPPATRVSGGREVARTWFWIIVAAGAGAVFLNWIFG
jgi:solute:Na+ symporter, SSS family